MEYMTEYQRQGYERGKSAGSWVFDGNTKDETYRWVLAGYDDSDPEVMDLCPAPLSGEWAGESISELFDLPVGQDYPTDEELSDYENGFCAGFWEVVIETANYMTGDN